MQTVDPIRDLPHTISTNGTNTVAEPQPNQETPPPRRRRSFAWLWLLLLAAAAYGAFHYWQAAQQKKQEAAAAQAKRAANRAVPVIAVPVRSGDMPVVLRGLGTVTPFNSVMVKSRVDGQLIAVNFQEGQFVKKGRPARRNRSTAVPGAARAGRRTDGARPGAAQRRAGQIWRATRRCGKRRSSPSSSWIRRRRRVGQYEGSIQADQAAIDNAKLQLTYAHITAPISGRIGLRQVDIGNIVHAADPNRLASHRADAADLACSSPFPPTACRRC